MNIKTYLNEIRKKINKIDAFVSNPINYEDLNNPFASTIPKTYIWIDEKDNNDN